MRDQQRNEGQGPGWSRHSPAAWFLQPPYPGAWIAGIVLLMLAVEALVLNQMWSRRRDTVAAVPVSPPVVVTPSGAAPVPPLAESPSVRVRSLPARPQPRSNVPATQANLPSVVPPWPGNVPVNLPANSPLNPGVIRPVDPDTSPTPVPVPDPVPTPEPERVPVSPVEPPRIRTVPEPRRARETGRLALFFDADSSTFARHHERMPLRVEVYVDGAKRLDSRDPEKREFPVGQLPAGRHEVRIVPYVADYPSEPFVGVVRIAPGEASTYKAVLRKSHDVSRVSKFEPRD